MATVSLGATLRNDSGKGIARKIRAQGKLPAVVYRGGEPATSIVIDPEALELAFKKTQDRNTLVVLDLGDGNERTCLVREAVRHPVSRRLEHVDFYEVLDDQQVVVDVDVNPVGTAKGTKLGGSLRLIRRTLKVRCRPADIPHSVDVDVTELLVGDLVRASQITPPARCELIIPSDFNVLTVIGKRGPLLVGDEEEAEGEGEGEGEEAAETEED